MNLIHRGALLCNKAVAGPWRRFAALCLVLLCGSAQVPAQEPGTEALAGVREWIDQSLESFKESREHGLRVEVDVGRVDPRLRLAPCGQIEPYLPPGSRLWGRTRVALRCVDGQSRWNITIPVTVKAWGTAWVLKRDVPAGAAIDDSDVMAAEVDWAAEASPVLVKPRVWVGQVAARNLGAGQAIRASSLKAAMVFHSGTQVRVLAVGRGFTISADGQALTSGSVGQTARVRMDNGRILNGTVLDANTVRVQI